MTEEFPKVTRAWLEPFMPLVIVAHPETLKKILKTTGIFIMLYM
jgi:hypothetical protein